MNDRQRFRTFSVRGILRIGEELHGGSLHSGDVIALSAEEGVFAFLPHPAMNSTVIGRPCRLTVLNGRNPPYIGLPGVVDRYCERSVVIRFDAVDRQTLGSMRGVITPS